MCLKEKNHNLEFVRTIIIELPPGKNVNAMLIEHGDSYLNSYIEKGLYEEKNKRMLGVKALSTTNEKIDYESDPFYFEIRGPLPMHVDDLTVTLAMENRESVEGKIRFHLNLYNFNEVKKICSEFSEITGCSINEILKELQRFVNLVEKYREHSSSLQEGLFHKSPLPPLLRPKTLQYMIRFLKSKDLINNFLKTLTTIGVVGDSDLVTLMLLAVISSKTDHPLTLMVYCKSQFLRTMLIKRFVEILPEEITLNLTHASSKSFYHIKRKNLENKVLIIHDFNNLPKETQRIILEMQNTGFISSLVTQKDRYGHNTTILKNSKMLFSSIVMTSTPFPYTNQASGRLHVHIYKEEALITSIHQVQTKWISGHIDVAEHDMKALFMKNVLRLLKPYLVVNTHAHKIEIPMDTQHAALIKNQILLLTSYITVINQFQRRRDKSNKLLATSEDLRDGIELYFAILGKNDDRYERRLMTFFHEIKRYLSSKEKQRIFTQREIREALTMSKTKTSYLIKALLEKGYLTIDHGSKNKGFHYVLKLQTYPEGGQHALKEMLLKQVCFKPV